MLFRWVLRFLGVRSRSLFKYHDGRKWRFVDPFVVARALFEAPGFDWDDTPKLLNTAHSPTQLNTFRVIADAVRPAFSLPPVEQGGLSELECFALLTEFREYLGGVKKNGSLFQTLPDSMVSEQLPQEIFPTKPGLDYGSTVNEPQIERPGSLAAGTSEI